MLAWKAEHFVCAKRLMPSLPALVERLEHRRHLRLTEEERRQVRTMSVVTTERSLQTQPRGSSAFPVLCNTVTMSLSEQEERILFFERKTIQGEQGSLLSQAISWRVRKKHYLGSEKEKIEPCPSTLSTQSFPS